MYKNNFLLNKLSFLLLIGISLFFFSCEKEIEFDFKTDSQKVVVEGSIENDMPPIIRLSKSLNYFGGIDLDNVSELYIRNAYIEVSDGNRTVILKEYPFEMPEMNQTHYFYTVDTTSFQDLTFVGELGKSYDLKIIIDEEEYTATTSIPFPKPLDSIWVQIPESEKILEELPEARELYANYHDPDTLGNYARVFTSINDGPFLASMFSTLSDEWANGILVDLQIMPGRDPLINVDSLENPFEQFFFYLGDTVIIKWSAIDKASFDFYNTLEFAVGSTGNPFAAPTKVLSNINGKNALGVWAGYGNSFHPIIIQDNEEEE